MIPKFAYVPGVWDRPDFLELLASRFPEINNGIGYALDLGCGSGFTRNQLEARGYQWVGVDINPSGATTIADGHSLPFQSETFGLIVSLAALEHICKPWLVARELGRVTRSGALFCGMTAFLEPMHAGSYFHMSHLGVNSFLEEGTFEVIEIWPGWHVFEAIAWFNLVENAGHRRWMYEPIRRVGLSIASFMHWLRAWRIGTSSWSETDHVIDRLRFSGSICFVARKL